MKHSFNMDENGKGDEKPNNETPKEEASVTAAQFADFMKKQEDLNNEVIEMRKKLAANPNNDLISAIRELTGQKGNVDASQVFDEDDYYEEKDVEGNGTGKGKEFYYYGFYTVLYADRRKNQSVLAPLGAIEFIPWAGIPQGSGKDQNILYIATYTSSSKKEIKWIKEHNWFINGLIVEKFNANTSVNDVLRSQRSARLLTSINAMAGSQVLRELNSRGIDYSSAQNDLPRMRSLLVEHLVDKEISEEEARSKKLVQESTKDNYMQRTAEEVEAIQ